jgi:hypothetical protein
MRVRPFQRRLYYPAQQIVEICTPSLLPVLSELRPNFRNVGQCLDWRRSAPSSRVLVNLLSLREESWRRDRDCASRGIYICRRSCRTGVPPGIVFSLPGMFSTGKRRWIRISNYMRTWSLSAPHHFLRSTLSAFRVLAAIASAVFKSRAALHLENLALRHQLGVLNRSVKRPKLPQPIDSIAWHRKGFRLFWTWKVRHGQPGRPAVPQDVRELSEN